MRAEKSFPLPNRLRHPRQLAVPYFFLHFSSMTRLGLRFQEVEHLLLDPLGDRARAGLGVDIDHKMGDLRELHDFDEQGVFATGAARAFPEGARAFAR